MLSVICDLPSITHTRSFKYTIQLITNMKTSERIKHIPTSFIREILNFASSSGVISFAGGIPEESLFPVSEIKQSVDNILSRNPYRALQYGPSEGHSLLREHIALEYQKKGIPFTKENILITNGSQQGLDLIGKLFLNKGDYALVEAPSYLGAIQSFSQYECNFGEVALEPDGLHIPSLEEQIWERNYKFMYMIPDFQNPTGYQYSLEKRKHTGEILMRKGIPIIEDRPYAELSFENQSLPSMLELFPESTIQLGSFSKILAPGLRIGWIAGPQKELQILKLLKQASDLHSNGLSQEIVFDLIQRKVVEHHIPSIITLYKERRDIMCQQLTKQLSDELSFSKPNGGMFCWATLKNTTSEKLLKDCMKEKLVFVPGHHFFTNHKSENTLRINFTKSKPEEIIRGIQIMKEQIMKTKILT